MNKKQDAKLQVACELLRQKIQNVSIAEDVSSRWKEMALRGSIQSRKNQKTLVRR